MLELWDMVIYRAGTIENEFCPRLRVNSILPEDLANPAGSGGQTCKTSPGTTNGLAITPKM